MTTKLLMGNEAMAAGALAAGVNVVCGYPGTPSSEVLETIAKNRPADLYVEWSINEKVALELAAGVSYAGGRALVTMKQMGLNVCADPLMCLSYVGCKGGLVVLVADDPGPISSQTEQDTRHFAKFANLPVLDPATPEQAYQMIQYAFELSEQLELPVFLRPTTRVCHACATIEVAEPAATHQASGFTKDSKWVIFPALSYRNHLTLEAKQVAIQPILAASPFNSVEQTGKQAVFVSGAASGIVREVRAARHLDLAITQIGTPYPFPQSLALPLLKQYPEILVIEELDAVIEEELQLICAKEHLPTDILGKASGYLPQAGEYSYEVIEQALCAFCGVKITPTAAVKLPSLPPRPPILCAGCPHRASFYAVKRAMRGKKAFFTGDIGCYTLGNAAPLDMVDTCLCMGAGITVAQGLQRMEPDAAHFAFIGDSTFFHTGLSGVINAFYNQTNINIVILDNSTTAMTGHQPHPGTGVTMMKTVSPKVDIAAVLQAVGIGFIRKVNPLDLQAACEAAREAAAYDGVAVIIYEAPCISLFRPQAQAKAYADCVGCGICTTQLGCPALVVQPNGKIKIDDGLCYGCGLCAQVCPKKCIFIEPLAEQQEVRQ